MDQERQQAKSASLLFDSILDHSDGYSRVSFIGELDLATEAMAAAALAAASNGPGSAVVVADLRSLDFMDCSGLRVLIDAATALESRGGALRVRLPDSGAARRIFEVLAGQLDIVYDNPT